MTKLIMVRHGETTWNIEHRAQGSKNIGLTENGLNQAKLLAQRLKHYNIDKIYSSDLDRAFHTAEMVAKELNQQVIKDNRLREMSFGRWEGLRISEIKEKYEDEFIVWRNNPHKALIPQAEKLIDVQNRTLEIINHIIKENKGKTILIVSHGISIKSMILGIMEMPLSDFYKITQNNTSINIIEYRDYGPVIKTLNDTAHLENIE
ncbi:MAG: histidine phosphatase family protein [Anaeromicrobium sp.]|uniref:histidine phosphatase family protein n=1 Tax=Anaeromicrobium sp. TaxID=1929132 RepID=UPI0025D78150|nr:histidine phosphatase family protein [Anaeromicrobium sp.]MCT4594706.1 histidine phosphatase family protein [Anaeromicrobium sp.]